MFEWLKAILGESYTEEIDKKVAAEIGKSFVPRTDFNTVNEAKKTLEGQIADRDKQLEELKKVDAAGLQAEITRLQGENKAAKEKFDADIAAVKLDAALDAAIIKAGGRNAKAIKALLGDTSAFSIEADGSVKGLNLEALKASDGYLFDVTTEHREGTGAPGGSGSGGGSDSEPPEDYDAYKAWREKNT